MTSEELESDLERRAGVIEDVQQDSALEQRERFLVFAVGTTSFALSPAAVREIVPGLTVFPIPGCPAYIPGLVNCHGKPYTVIDLRVLFENERQIVDQFLVLNLENDDVALGCTEVEEIVEVAQSALSSFAANDAAGRFCSAMLEHGDRRIPVLAIAQILKELEHDLA